MVAVATDAGDGLLDLRLTSSQLLCKSAAAVSDIAYVAGLCVASIPNSVTWRPLLMRDDENFWGFLVCQYPEMREEEKKRLGAVEFLSTKRKTKKK